MSQKYIKQDCKYCKTIHTMMLMANGICKCPSCLRKYKVKDPLDKIFVKFHKIEEGMAKRILGDASKLSVRNIKWDIPLDLLKFSRPKEHDTFIGVGRWIGDTKEQSTNFICIAKNNELVFLEPEVIKLMYNSIKDVKKR